VIWDNGASDNFFLKFDGSDEFKFSVGRAFWIINRGPLNINTTVPTEPLNAGEVEILLHDGWNLITNPFDKAINWPDVQILDSKIDLIYSFDGNSFPQSDSFDPLTGYYYFNDPNTSLSSLKIPFSLTFSSSSAIESKDEYIWQVLITLEAGDFTDNSTSLGTAVDASLDLDRLDYRKPRSVGPLPSVYFYRPDWDADYSIFASDIRPEFAEEENWEFQVSSIPGKPATLNFEGVERIPSFFEIYLIEEHLGKYVNLRDNPSYTFTPHSEITDFKVIIGKADVVQEQLNSVIPKDFFLGQNYPNPFNPSTKIPVSVPFTTHVELAVYNILGEEVRTIYSGTLAAGRHLFEWDGKDVNRKALSSGIYIYRLTTGKKVSLIGKMILLK